MNTVNQARCYGASDTDSVKNLYRRLYADVPEFPPTDYGPEIPDVGQTPTNLTDYDAFLRK